MGGNQSSVTAVGVAGAMATVIMWLLGFFAPGLMDTAPVGLEAAFTAILMAALCYWLPTFHPETAPVSSKEGGFARVKMLVVVALAAAAVTVFSACASLSFDQRLAAAYTTNTSIRSTATAALNGGRLTSEQGEHVLQLTDQTRAVLDDAADGDERGLRLAVEIMGTLEEFAR